MQAARLLENGYTETDVVRRVGVHRQSVNRWAKEWATGGRSQAPVDRGRSAPNRARPQAGARSVHREIKPANFLATKGRGSTQPFHDRESLRTDV